MRKEKSYAVLEKGIHFSVAGELVILISILNSVASLVNSSFASEEDLQWILRKQDLLMPQMAINGARRFKIDAVQL